MPCPRSSWLATCTSNALLSYFSYSPRDEGERLACYLGPGDVAQAAVPKVDRLADDVRVGVVDPCGDRVGREREHLERCEVWRVDPAEVWPSLGLPIRRFISPEAAQMASFAASHNGGTSELRSNAEATASKLAGLA